ncbi:MAG: hypothetical protein ACFBWO_09450 [Paracoccaceae bacterium]
MGERLRRVDVRIGEFACSIQGFDDPAAVLARLIDVAREAPASGPHLDEAAAERALAAAARESGLAPERLAAVPGFIVTVAPLSEEGAVETDEPGPSRPEPEASEIRRALESAALTSVAEPASRRGRATRFAGGWEETPAAAPDEAIAPVPAPGAPAESLFATVEADDEPPLLLAPDPEPEPAAPRRSAPVSSLFADDDDEPPLRASLSQRLDEEVRPRGRPKPPLTPQALSWKMNARQPDEQIVCACAFLTFEEKKPRFTRRDAWRVLDQIPGEVVRNLTVRVRAFGKLVRDGVIVQHASDSFSLSDVEMARAAEYFED